MVLIEIQSGGMHFVIDKDHDGRARLIHFSPYPFDKVNYREENYSDYHTLLELHTLGSDIHDNHASRHTKMSPGWDLLYEGHTIEKTDAGKHLSVMLVGGGMEVTAHFQFYDGIAQIRSYLEVKNVSEKMVTIDYISSFKFAGIAKEERQWDTDTYLYTPHNSWKAELQWRKHSIHEEGLTKCGVDMFKKLSWHQTGTWSSSEYIPMGIMELPNSAQSYYWQIEHNGSWYTEIGNADEREGLYLQLAGPQHDHNHFLKNLSSGETFTSVCVSCGVCNGGFESAIRELTKYRRRIRRTHKDNEELPVIYNDYMNSLWAQPTEEKELPLIDAAAEIGAEYFVIDAGWFAEAEGPKATWWPSIGVWKESTSRFPRGLRFVIDYIREKGMKPGLWIEIEGVGPDCEILDTMPDDWFFQIHGQRTMERYRYQLDFRNPQVRRFATEAVENIIKKYDIAYLKIDYNRNAGLGTDYNAESIGSGLLDHCRAYLAWLDELMDKYPNVVFENCASGGMRTDYAMLSRCSIHSTSDQDKYDLYASISAMAGSAIAPEQAAVWSYPSHEADEEETCFNMINAMLARVHQSGFLNRLQAANFEHVKEGIACYKTYRKDIKNAYPRFPLGLIGFHAPWAVTALDCDTHWYMAVYRKGGENEVQEIPIDVPKGKTMKAECIYPKGLPVEYECDNDQSLLRVRLKEKFRARLFKIIFE